MIRGNDLRARGHRRLARRHGGREVLDNRIEGDENVRSPGSRQRYPPHAVKDALVRGNRVSHTATGSTSTLPTTAASEANRFQELPTVHYMFTHNSRVTDNLTRRTRTGYALMQSRKLTGDRQPLHRRRELRHPDELHHLLDPGRQPRRGRARRQHRRRDDFRRRGKALFIYNSCSSRIEGNSFADSALASHLTAGSEDNRIAGNAFIGNRQQVKYVASREQE
ncbi:NosD domain-containing protein [Pseudomonas aeruginosa]